MVDGVETRFVRDTNFNVVQERDGSNNIIRSYVWNPTAPGGIGGILELTQGGQHYNYLLDGKGNVIAIIDENQNVVASYAYDSFGALTSKSGALDQPYMFSTKYYYPELGLVYYGYRFYNPIIGKWMTRDPMGENGGENLYGAMGNNLIDNIDPFGLRTYNITDVFDPLISSFQANGFQNSIRGGAREKYQEEMNLANKYNLPGCYDGYLKHKAFANAWLALSNNYSWSDALIDMYRFDYDEAMQHYKETIENTPMF